MARSTVFLALLTGLLFQAPPVAAQEGPARSKAFLLSLVVPGLGHRYVNQGSWDGAASLFLAADAALWTGLIGTIVRHDRLTDSYRTLASLRAGADVSGKDRTYFLTIGTYRSSDAFVEQQLRNRAWDQLDYVENQSYQWEWRSEQDFQRFRALRDDAESMRRRRPVLAALLVGNRLVSGLLSIRAAGGASDGEMSMSLEPNYLAPDRPALNLRARF